MIKVTVAAGVGVWAAVVCAVAWGQDAAEPPASQPASAVLSPAAQQELAETMDQARQMTAAADGLALWEKFLADHPSGPAADQARREVAIWKDRVDKNLARFGQAWLPKAEVDKRTAKADELVGQAEAAADTDKAVKLLTDAAVAHPYRLDIPFKKFQILLKANREQAAGGALGGVLRVEPQNVPALNNLGVLGARQKQWATGLDLLLKAAGRTDKDVVWDNLDQAMAMAAEESYSGVAAVEQQVRGLVAKLHKAGKHAGETRWGNSWISESDYVTYVKDNQEANRKSAAARSRLAQVNARIRALEKERERLEKIEGVENQRKKVDQDLKELGSAAEKFKKEIDQAKAAGHEPNHAGKLVLLNLDGSEMESLEPRPAGPDGKDQTRPKDDVPRWLRDDPKDRVRNAPK